LVGSGTGLVGQRLFGPSDDGGIAESALRLFQGHTKDFDIAGFPRAGGVAQAFRKRLQ
jgi:hypothetical protein